MSAINNSSNSFASSDVLRSNENRSTPHSKIGTDQCLAIALQILDDPKTLLAGADLTALRSYKRELKGRVKDLQERENQVSKKILKGIQNVLNISRVGQSKLDAAKTQYNTVKELYQAVVKTNPSAIEAKRVQNLIKEANTRLSNVGGDWKRVDSEFRAMFDNEANKLKLFGRIYGLLSPKTDRNLQQRDAFLERLVNGLEQLRLSTTLKDKRMTWLHGTRSPALTLILTNDQHLHPAGVLIKRNIIPLTGELGKGISQRGINQKNISGTSISRLGVKTAIEYASDFQTNLLEEWQKVSITRINKKIDFTQDILTRDPDLKSQFAEGIKYDWLAIGLNIERLKVIDPDYSDKIEELKNHLKEQIADRKDQPHQEVIVNYLKDLLAKCDTKPFTKPTKNIREHIANSFPVVLGAHNVKTIPINSELDEYAVKGSVSLKKVLLAFTTTENVPRLTRLIKDADLDIEVMDFDGLRAISIDSPEIGEVKRVKKKKVSREKI